MSQKTQQDSMPIAEAVDLPEISVEHSTEFLTGSAPCAGVSRPLPAAWLGQRGIYRSRLEAVCNGEQLVDPLTLRELIQHAWRYLYLTRRAGLGLKPARQPLTSTTKTPEATDATVDQMIAEEDADIRQDLTQQAEAERPEVVAWQYRVTAGPQTGWSLWHPGKGEEFERSYTVERRPLMTVAQHDRIVGSLRAKADQLREALEWRKENQAGQRELLRSVTAERDAALAEVERLRQFERICEGLPQDAIDGGWTVHGIRAHSKQLEEQLKVALARVAELEKQEPVAWVDVDWIAQVSDPRGDGCTVRRAYGSAGVGLVPLYAAPVAQAQHSVPGNAAALVRAEGKKYSLNAAGMLDSGAPEHAQTFAIAQLLSEFDDEEAESHWEAIMAYSDFRTSDALFHAAELLAAAPGKEVGHE